MSLNGTVWTPIGPSPITEPKGHQDNGMVTAIAPHPFNPSVIYIGTGGGGVWRTRDGGATWTPLFDRQLALGIGEPAGIAIDPNHTDTIYVGSSERVLYQNTGIFGSPDSSQGLFKSTDGGNSWIQLGSGFPAGNVGSAINFVGQWINVVIVDPADSSGNTLYLASSHGVFWSTDAGLNWTQGNHVSGDARSLVLDTSSPSGSRILYAGVSKKGAFQSKDGGRNWQEILSGSTAAVKTAVGAPPNGFGKVIIAIPPPAAPPNPAGIQILYVTLQGTGGAPDPVGVFLSADQGGTWTQQSAAGMPNNSQNGYSFHMAVDPASPGDGVHDIIYFGTVHQAKSTDSGGSFSKLNVLHADTHSWAFIPRPSPKPSTVFCGNDGGIDTSPDGGVTWNPLNSGGLQTALFFNISVKPDATASVVVGGAQDNGLQTTATAASPNWVSQGADGYGIAYDGVTPKRVYGSSGYWSGTPPIPCTEVLLSNDDGVTFPTFITPWTTATDTGCYLAPISTDPSNANTVYASGSQNLWQSRDAGTHWRKLSAFGKTGDVDVAAVNGNYVVIGVGKQVFVSTNALSATVGPPSGVTFANITRNLPGRNVARVVFDPVDPTVIYAVLGGLNGSGTPGHVFRTTVTAPSWTDISPTAGNPPVQVDIPCNAIALDGTDVPTTIYVGTDLGVIRSVDGGASWYILDDIHFPRVPVLDLALNQAAGVLCAGTYGRGVFKFIKPTGPAITVSLEDNLSFGTICSGPDYLTLTVYNVGVKDLTITSVQRLMGSTDFTVLPTPSTPLIVAPGDNVEFTIQYTPTVSGTLETAIIRVSSNDPTAPFVDLTATGMQGTGTLAAAIANSGFFGNVCLGSFADELLTIDNSGSCPLVISSITSSSPDFLVPGVVSYPLVVSAGGAIDLMIRFQPSGLGATSGIITIRSENPASATTIGVSGEAPSGTLAVTGSTNFGGVTACCCADRTLSICNVGECSLRVTSVSFKRKSHHWKLLNNPFPATLTPGSCLPVVIQYKATERCSRCCELVIESDDPITPAKVLEVLAYTIWCDCERGEDCENCRTGRCERHHKPGCRQGYPCCDDGEDDATE